MKGSGVESPRRLRPVYPGNARFLTPSGDGEGAEIGPRQAAYGNDLETSAAPACLRALVWRALCRGVTDGRAPVGRLLPAVLPSRSAERAGAVKDEPVRAERSESRSDRLDGRRRAELAVRGAASAWGTAVRDDYARRVAYAFDPSHPGARRLLEVARHLKRGRRTDSRGDRRAAGVGRRGSAAPSRRPGGALRPALPEGSSPTASRARPSSVARQRRSAAQGRTRQSTVARRRGRPLAAARSRAPAASEASRP